MRASMRARQSRMTHVRGDRSGLRRLADGLLDAAFPSRCVGCNTEGPPLCGTCQPALDVRRAAPAGVPIGLPGTVPAPLLQLEWCAPFRGIVRDALHRLKYAGEQRLADPMGAAIARRWSLVGVGADLVTHVPVHADRARARGYDQAELIARSAARHLGLPFAPLLERRRATIAQVDLDRVDRAANVQGAFGVRSDAAARVGDADPGWPLDGRWILLIDDVTTTGATLAACAEALEAAGATAVSAITVARER